MNDNSRTTAMGLWSDAKDMLDAAKLLLHKEEQRLKHPLYYLLGHGLEEAFKAFIRANGASLQCLKSIGHDLELACDWANTSGLAQFYSMDGKDNQTLSMFNTYYRSKQFEYRVTGPKSFPEAEALIGLLERLLCSIKDICVKSISCKD